MIQTRADATSRDPFASRTQSLVANILFSALDPNQLADCISAMVRIDCRPGDKLIKQGDVGDNFYVVQSVRAPLRRASAPRALTRALSVARARALTG